MDENTSTVEIDPPPDYRALEGLFYMGDGLISLDERPSSEPLPQHNEDVTEEYNRLQSDRDITLAMKAVEGSYSGGDVYSHLN